MSKHVIIVGGGITGITAAYQLIKQGFKVSVVERHRYPAMETSYANGGQLSASNAEVWTHPRHSSGYSGLTRPCLLVPSQAGIN